MLQPRLHRYKNFIQFELADSILWNNDYEFLNFTKIILDKFNKKQFNTIIFYGMGCSAIVADILKSFFISENLLINIIILNDYHVEYLIDIENYISQSTLFIITSYSGRTQEPLLFFKKIKKITNNIIFLTSGGQILQIACKENIPTIRLQLRKPDPEYPLFHVPQFLSILLNVFFNLHFIKSNYINQFRIINKKMRNVDKANSLKHFEYFSKKLRDSEIILIANPKWYLALLKLIKMHFNEVAMASAHRNYFHEFTHSEIALLSDPKQKISILLFHELSDDKLTNKKIVTIMKLFNKKYSKNINIELFEFEIQAKNFLEEFLITLQKFYYYTYFLGRYNDTINRDLIYNAAVYTLK